MTAKALAVVARGGDVGAPETASVRGDRRPAVAAVRCALVEQAAVEIDRGVDRQPVEDGGKAQRDGVELDRRAAATART